MSACGRYERKSGHNPDEAFRQRMTEADLVDPLRHIALNPSHGGLRRRNGDFNIGHERSIACGVSTNGRKSTAIASSSMTNRRPLSRGEGRHRAAALRSRAVWIDTPRNRLLGRLIISPLTVIAFGRQMPARAAHRLTTSSRVLRSASAVCVATHRKRRVTNASWRLRLSNRDERGGDAGRPAVMRLGANDGPDEGLNLIHSVRPLIR